jgi:K+-sensing histidine kinase KdpD
VLLALAASFGLAWLFAGTKGSTAVPLWFIVVLYALARRYGFAVGVIGSLLCAFVFAHFLFDPTGNWHVEDVAARRNLVWMIAGATAVSYLLAPPSSQRKGS